MLRLSLEWIGNSVAFIITRRTHEGSKGACGRVRHKHWVLPAMVLGVMGGESARPACTGLSASWPASQNTGFTLSTPGTLTMPSDCRDSRHLCVKCPHDFDYVCLRHILVCSCCILMSESERENGSDYSLIHGSFCLSWHRKVRIAPTKWRHLTNSRRPR